MSLRFFVFAAPTSIVLLCLPLILDQSNVLSNLGCTHLGGADLRLAQLSGANLSETNLSGANLFGANLKEANLEFARVNSFTYIDKRWRSTWWWHSLKYDEDNDASTPLCEFINW